MFCWWQDCPPTMEGPCRDRGPFSPCLSIPANPLSFGSSSLLASSLLSSSSSHSSSSSATSEITTKLNIINLSSTAKPLSATKSSNSVSDKLVETSTGTENIPIETSSRVSENSTSNGNKCCIVMGREYQIGDKLPHDTGNCLECICGQGAKVTCSPHQCAPVEDDMNDYHLSGARQQVVPDIF
ncbi:unnamed protein product [Psylliodes chrysocephalus]|uniref:VWFC domain-containing protein n=1 Tax=Psylliodes chrysocephalus TaxID=3402493 RepID=A0A9P0GAT6_9CUCU|nr:unnamed protein product [Psylliodes chrysocephala]